MSGIAILLAGAAVGYGFARWLKLPAIPFLVLAGVVLVSFGVLPPEEVLESVLVLGVTFLVFTAGIELNPSRVGAQKSAAIRVGILQFAILGVAGWVCSLALGFNTQTSLYLGLALSASSTLVVVRLLQQRRQLFEPFGRMVIGMLLLQDLFVILLIPVLTRLPEGIGAAFRGLVGALGLVALAYVFLRWITPFLVIRLKLEGERLLLTVLALLFVFMGLAALLRLPIVAGAFVAGVSLSPFPVSGLVRGQLSPIADFFLATFFTALGGVLGLPSMPDLLRAIALSLVVVILTPPIVTIIAERSGLSSRSAIEGGLLVAQTSEFSLIIGLQALILEQIPSNVFTVIALVTVMTMILTPFLATDRVTWKLMGWHPLRRLTPGTPPSGHVLLLGCGDNGLPLLETLVAAGHSVLVVDDDPSILARLREGDVPCIRGDASDYAVLERAGAANARVIVSTIRRPADNVSLFRRVHGVPVVVRVFDTEDADRISQLGGTPILYSQAAAEDFVQWFQQAAEVGLRQERRTRPRAH